MPKNFYFIPFGLWSISSFVLPVPIATNGHFINAYISIQVKCSLKIPSGFVYEWKCIAFLLDLNIVCTWYGVTKLYLHTACWQIYSAKWHGWTNSYSSMFVINSSNSQSVYMLIVSIIVSIFLSDKKFNSSELCICVSQWLYARAFSRKKSKYFKSFISTGKFSSSL